MLKKLLLSLGMVFIAFLTGYATAQSFFLNNAPGSPAAGAGGSAQNQSVMNPSDFQSQTDQIQQKKDQALSDQLKQNLSKIPPTPPPPPPVAAAAPAATPEAGAAATSQPTAPTTGQSTTPAAPAPTSVPAEESAAAPAPSGPTPTAPAASAPSQSNVYTGFQGQGQDQNQNQNQNQSGKSGGWNIKY